ncbi:MAG: proline--tRNA ligase [Candidatus Micrarchaeota archaeon]|nr:proline--tRNA ligase [Candidatus Micrarchaeota archaeon]
MNIDKQKNFSEWYNTVLDLAELSDIRYNVKGCIVIRPWAAKTIKLMYEEYEKELERNGHKPVIFPALIPKKNFDIEKEHVKGFSPEVFWVEKAGKEKLEEKLALRPTSETAMYQMFSLWIQGIVDLPLKVYQSCQVWRYETKATKPFFRSREFYWIEAHTAFATEKEAIEQVKQDMQMTEHVVFEKFKIPFIFFQRPEWDKFPGAQKTFAADTLMPDKKVLQLPSTHLLGQNFSKAFDVGYLNSEGKKEYVWQTCYGPAISRIYGAMICIHGDERGIMLPFEFCPVHIVIIPILTKEVAQEKITQYCHSVYKIISNFGYRTILDESENTPGYKYNYWEVRGVPIRIEIGIKEVEEGKVTLALRDKKEKEQKLLVAVEDLSQRIRFEANEFNKRLEKRAIDTFQGLQTSAYSIEELEQKAKDFGLIKIPFCSIEANGETCAKFLKDKYSLDVRGIKYLDAEKPIERKCIVCKKEAKEFVYVAKQY